MTTRYVDRFPGVLATFLALVPIAASAQTVLSVRDVDTAPGATGVVVPITLESSQNLTLLRFDVVFNPAGPTGLCAQLVNPNGITVRKAGPRTIQEAAEQPVTCSSGRIRTAVIGLMGDTVIQSGTGPILEIVLGALQPGAAGHFALTPQVFRARNGPVVLTPTVDAGELRIGCMPDCDDGNSCTSDQCDPSGPICTHTCMCGCTPCP